MPFSLNPTKALAILAIVAATVYIVVANRGPAAFTGSNIATFLVVGLSLGGIYAIVASGLVVTYTTTGIFNFAHCAIGAFLAFFYWELRVNRSWPAPLALIVTIFVVAPAIGLVLDVLLMRRLRQSPLVIQLMVTVGLMLLFMGVTAAIWKPTVGRTMTPFFRDAGGIQIVDVVATWHRIITIAVAAGIAVVLRVLLYRTRLGVTMRAVVDNPALAGLTGARSTVVSGASWALGCMLAGMAGILIAPETGMVVETLTLIIVVAFACAAIAQLKSLPWAFAGGLLIGLATAFAGVFLVFDSNWSHAPDAIPAIVLLVALLFLPHAPLEKAKIRTPRWLEHLATPKEALFGAAAIFLVVAAWANGWIPWFSGTNFGERSPIWLGRGAAFMVVGLIMLSLVPLIGWAGQVCFANFAIAGFGAVMYSHLGGQDGNAYALVLVALISAPLGCLVALPALRLKGLYLALATMAFAELADKLFFRHPAMIDGTNTGVLFKPLQLFGFQISSDAADRKAFLIFVTVVFCLLFLVLQLVRRSGWNRRWVAIADSPAASATVGINLTVGKMAVFAFSGAIAGFAGCLYGLSKGSLGNDSFLLFAGLPLVLLLALQGVRYPIAPFIAAIGLAAFPAIQELLGHPSYLSSFELLGPGLLALAMVSHPDGLIADWSAMAGLLPWRHDARRQMTEVAAKARDEDITRDEIGDLGIRRPFTDRKVAQLDAVLGVSDALRAPPPTEPVPLPVGAEGQEVVRHGAAVS